MKFSNFDEDFRFKKRRTSDTMFIIKVVSIISAIFVIMSSFLFTTKIGSSDSYEYEIEEKAERYGNSEFIKYQGKISVLLPSGGRYILDDVDINSFRTLSLEDRNTRIIGLDKKSVYFGNILIPDLDPNKLEVIGNGYYTDGTNTYFCSPFSERNKNLSSIMEGLQSLTYSFSKTKKPQSYIYPYKKIETNKKLRAVENLFSFATDGERVYYEGEVLENADNVNPNKIRELIENKKLIAISGEKKMEIVVKYESDILIAARYSKIFLGIFVVIIGIFNMYQKIRKEEYNENKW